MSCQRRVASVSSTTSTCRRVQCMQRRARRGTGRSVDGRPVRLRHTSAARHWREGARQGRPQVYLPLIAVGFGGLVRVSISWGVGLLAPLVLLALWLGANRQLSGDKASNGPAKDKDKRVQTEDASATSARPPVRGWQSELHAWKLAQVHLGELGRGDHVDRLSNRLSTTTHDNRGAPGPHARPPTPPEVDHVDQLSTPTHNNRGGAPRSRALPPPPPEVVREASPRLRPRARMSCPLP